MWPSRESLKSDTKNDITVKSMRVFSESDINVVYNNYVNKSNDYYKKYESLPFEYNIKNWKWEGKDFPRIWAILDFSEWVEKYNLKNFKKVLLTCDSDPEIEYLTYEKAYYAPYYNGHNDLHTLDLEERDFDFILFNQTIEHLYNPFLSLQKLYEHTAPGGYVFTSVPTINIPHMMPVHFNGYTPMGLCMLMLSVGFEIMELGFWGNMDYINFIFEKQTWPDYLDLMKDGIITNEKNRNVQCWILVRKPL
jgi:SAM-dependent methyltransferase